MLVEDIFCDKKCSTNEHDILMTNQKENGTHNILRIMYITKTRAEN